MTSKKKNGGRVTESPNLTARKERKRREWSYELIQEAKEPMRETVPMPLKVNIATDFEKAKKDLELAIKLFDVEQTEARANAVEAAKAEFDRLDDLLYETSVEFELVGMGRKKSEQLMDKHPPTAAQIEAYQKKLKALGKPIRDNPLLYNQDTFPPALIFHCLEYPEMTLEQVEEMWNSDQWGRAELGALFSVAIMVSNVMG